MILMSWWALAVADCQSDPKKFYELRGTLLDPIGGHNVTVQLSAPYGSADLSTQADLKGKFRFKRVPAGIYVLTAFIPRAARTRRTVEVGPSFADEKGRIEIGLELQPRPRRPNRHQVTTEQLAIPDKARAEYNKGLQRISSHDSSGAAACFRRAVEAAPLFSLAWYQLGLIACQQKRMSDAEEYFRDALKGMPENYLALLNLGGVLLTQRNTEGAVAVNQQAVEVRPDDAQAQAQLGYSYLLAGRLEEAEIHLKQTVALDPANYFYPQILLAEIYRRRNDLSSMARELEEFLRLHPDSPKAGEVAPILEEIRSKMPAFGGTP